MNFKTPHLAAEFNVLHPELIETAMALDKFCVENKFPALVVTHVDRTIADQSRIYYKQYMRSGLTEAQAMEAASKRPSLHLHKSACDFRDYIYTRQQIKLMLDFLFKRCPKERYEVLHHDVGSGMHFHLGIRDPQWIAVNPSRKV
jgi:hypothetical protein